MLQPGNAAASPYSNRMRPTPATILRHLAAATLFAGCAGGLVGCDETYEEETVLFERAEQRYAAGDYDGAVERYERFLEIHPLSPLAPIAEQRLRNVEREIDAVMGRRGAPAPIRVNPFGGAEAPGPEAVPPEVEQPRLPSLGE